MDEDVIHIWYAPQTPEEDCRAIETAPCGVNMYPDTRNRPEHTDDPFQVTCLACLRLELDRMQVRAGGLADLLGLYSEEEIEDALEVG